MSDKIHPAVASAQAFQLPEREGRRLLCENGLNVSNNDEAVAELAWQSLFS